MNVTKEMLLEAAGRLEVSKGELGNLITQKALARLGHGYEVTSARAHVGAWHGTDEFEVSLVARDGSSITISLKETKKEQTGR